MKRSIIFALVVILCIISPTISPAQKGDILDKGVNRLQNGDFEDDPILPWLLEVRQDMGAAAIMEVTKKTAAKGSRSMLVTVTKSTGTDWHVKLRQDERCFEKNKKFTVAFWSKAEKPRVISMAFQLMHDPWTVFGNQNFNIETEWKEFSMTFTPSVDNFQDHWLAFQVGNSDILIWFDDVRYFLGEPKDEVGREPIKQSVDQKEKLTTTWSKIKLIN
jgi:hypothetical protein